MFLLKNTDINISEGSIFSIIAIVIVFANLLFIVICVELLAKFKLGNKEEEPKPVQNTYLPVKKFTIDDIKDEDMMVAALIATAEYVEETKETDARLVSIKQIG